MTKFVAFEKVAETVFARLDKSKLSDGAQTTVNLGSGLIAGFAAAIVSQPADTMLSKINKTKGRAPSPVSSRLRVSLVSVVPLRVFLLVWSWLVVSLLVNSPSMVTSRRLLVSLFAFSVSLSGANFVSLGATNGVEISK